MAFLNKTRRFPELEGEIDGDVILGVQGPPGPMGPAGPQGPVGETGSIGPRGPIGETGPAGPQGPAGEAGLAGPAGPRGATGPAGADGKSGTDGITPHIGENGNWFIGENDTGIPATGPTGNQGLPGPPGKDGIDGKDGKPGKDGPSGADGYTPQKGVDYWTDADKAEIIEEIIASIPTVGGIVVYTNPAEPVPIKNGSQLVFYVNQPGKVTMKIGKASHTVDFSDTTKSEWVLWLQSTNTGGSIITPSGTRKWMAVGGIAENVLFSYDGTGSLVVGVME